MYVRFRPHRGSLADSLDETVIIHDRNHLVSHLQNESNYLQFESADVTVDNYGLGIDERCGWNTHIVRIQGMAVGFTDGMI
jgi:hypothetical protein